MLAKRTNRKTVKRKGKPAWYKKKYNALEIASKAAAGVWYLKGLINSELKIHQVLAGPQDIDYAGRLDAISAIGQGDTEITRDGNSVFARYLNIKGVVKVQDATQPALVRLMIVQDNSTDPSSTSVSDIIAQSTISTVYAPMSQLNRDTAVGRFKVLASKMLTVGNLANQSLAYNFNIEMRHHIKYDGAAVNDYKKGNIWFLQISDLTGTAVPVNTYMSRLKFYDN